jgi:hypothetical protein
MASRKRAILDSHGKPVVAPKVLERIPHHDRNLPFSSQLAQVTSFIPRIKKATYPPYSFISQTQS